MDGQRLRDYDDYLMYEAPADDVDSYTVMHR